eukprot:Sspe_Gene.102312::Locus_77323_Transcript_1_1_Confidence_1.000_Length_678::g.102312::m.102312
MLPTARPLRVRHQSSCPSRPPVAPPFCTPFFVLLTDNCTFVLAATAPPRHTPTHNTSSAAKWCTDWVTIMGVTLPFFSERRPPTSDPSPPPTEREETMLMMIKVLCGEGRVLKKKRG